MIALREARKLVSASWSLTEARARLSEVVRKARTEGVQIVTVRGRRAVAVISVEELDRLRGDQPTAPLVEFLESLRLHELDLERESDTGRDGEQ